MFRPLAATLALILLSPAALAQDLQAESGKPPQRIRQVNLAADEKCPQAAPDEIVVCSRIDPSEQYRLPKALRSPAEIPAPNQSWANRAEYDAQVSRVAAGLPNTCSPIGTGGQTGCFAEAARAYAAEKRQQQREAERATPGTTITIEEDVDD